MLLVGVCSQIHDVFDLIWRLADLSAVAVTVSIDDIQLDRGEVNDVVRVIVLTVGGSKQVRFQMSFE